MKDKSVTRRTTEVLVDVVGGGEDPLTRARVTEPALVTLHGDIPGQVFRLRQGRQVIGRRPECDIRMRERAVSGLHAEIIRNDAGVTIRDLASTNGTIVNGRRIKDSLPLVQGNLVRIGTCVFKYVDSLLDVEFTEALHRKGITDELTGTYNKPYLLARLAFVLDLADATHPVSVIAFDYDNFKQINDEYGHAAGDHVLRASAELIRSTCVRTGDLFARVGGEEFVIVLPDTGAKVAERIAETIRRTLLDARFAYEGNALRLTASLGVCTTADSSEPPASLLERADELLYRSKREGRNRVTVWA
jgi:diguanylate cyclase (GGDEF)-like protein